MGDAVGADPEISGEPAPDPPAAGGMPLAGGGDMLPAGGGDMPAAGAGGIGDPVAVAGTIGMPDGAAVGSHGTVRVAVMSFSPQAVQTVTVVVKP